MSWLWGFFHHAMVEAKAVPPPAVFRWIRTDYGRAQYAVLAARPGPLAKPRLAWFVLIAALRDWPLTDPTTPTNPDQGNS